VPIAEQDVLQVVEVVWSSVLGLQVKKCAEADVAVADRGMTASVQIRGAWIGSILLDCSSTLAKKVASIMFDVEPAAATDEEIHDSLGELANILGGNLKALLPGPSKLSLPDVVEGTLQATKRSNLHLIAFECEGDLFHVAVVANDAAIVGGHE